MAESKKPKKKKKRSRLRSVRSRNYGCQKSQVKSHVPFGKGLINRGDRYMIVLHPHKKVDEVTPLAQKRIDTLA